MERGIRQRELEMRLSHHSDLISHDTNGIYPRDTPATRVQSGFAM
jgi:hypothetical protein